MSSSLTSIESASPRLLQEHIESSTKRVLQLQDEIDKYTEVAETITDLPSKLQHQVMVPIGKRAMMPGKIVRTNEVLSHLGDEYFAWTTAKDAVALIGRKKKDLQKQIQLEEVNLTAVQDKKSEVEKLLDIKKLYDDENIKEIQETEDEIEQYTVTEATDEDVEEYFEMENEERRKNENTVWDWDETMKRMEELEAMENREAMAEDDTTNQEQVRARECAQLKARGNAAFSRRDYQTSIDLYSKAIELDPTSHILYGNRSAAYHRLEKHIDALKDAKHAVELDDTWVKGHYRVATALASLRRYSDAVNAFERALALNPTDTKLQQQADEMRTLATKQSQAVPAKPATTSTNPTSVSTKVFTGGIVERPVAADEVPPVATTTPTPTVRRSRFAANKPGADVVTLEPVGEAQPVKRVSRFKAQRSGGQ